MGYWSNRPSGWRTSIPELYASSKSAVVGPRSSFEQNSFTDPTGGSMLFPLKLLLRVSESLENGSFWTFSHKLPARLHCRADRRGGLGWRALVKGPRVSRILGSEQYAPSNSPGDRALACRRSYHCGPTKQETSLPPSRHELSGSLPSCFGLQGPLSNQEATLDSHDSPHVSETEEILLESEA